MTRNKKRRNEGKNVALIIDRWNSMKNRCAYDKGYKSIKIKITRDQFIDWSLEDPNFKHIFENWVITNINKEKPSIDRIDPMGHYEIGNIRWITYSQNSKLGSKGFRKRKQIDQLTKNLELIKTFISASEAAREMGVNSVNISVCAQGKQKTAYGYIWRYHNKHPQ